MRVVLVRCHTLPGYGLSEAAAFNTVQVPHAPVRCHAPLTVWQLLGCPDQGVRRTVHCLAPAAQCLS